MQDDLISRKLRAQSRASNEIKFVLSQNHLFHSNDIAVYDSSRITDGYKISCIPLPPPRPHYTSEQHLEGSRHKHVPIKTILQCTSVCRKIEFSAITLVPAKVFKNHGNFFFAILQNMFIKLGTFSKNKSLVWEEKLRTI